MVILALLVCLWIIWDDSQDGSSNTSNLTRQTASDDGAPDSISAGNRGTERTRVRFGAAYPEGTTPNQRRLPSSGGTKKRRAVQLILTGFVANSQDAAPIPEARVTLSSEGNEDVRIEAVSGHDGRFRMTIDRAGRYMLHAEADGFESYFIDRLFITPAQGTLGKNILMTPEVELRGRVVDRHSRGIANASVWIRIERARGFRQSSLGRTDEFGRFRMARALASGDCFIAAAHPEYELDSRVPVTLPQVEEVVVTMRRVPDTLLASLSGRVRNTDGDLIHGAWVRLEATESRGQLSNGLGDSWTDPEGRFFFPRVRLGKYQVIAEAQGYAHAIHGQGIKDLTIESSGKYEIDLIVDYQTKVQGVVFNPEGVPLAEADVTVWFETGTGRTGTGVGTSPDGTFDIPQVPPGRHRIQVTHSDYVTYESNLVTPTDDLLTVTLQTGLSLTGYVVDQNNEPIREFSLELSPISSLQDSKSADISPADGHFRVNGLTPQTYFLSVRPPNADGWFTRFELLESTSVTVVLNRSDSGSRIRIRKF